MTRNPGIPLVLLLSLLACDQQPAGPGLAVRPDFAGASLDKNQILRFQDHYATSWSDSRSSLRATHTTFAIPDPNDGLQETNCGPQTDQAMIDFQQVGVVNPVDFFLSDLHLKASGPVWVIVRDLSQPGDCYGVKLIAEGPGQLQYLDNDAFGAQPGQTFADSWGFQASGTLMTPSGQQVSYQGNARYVAQKVKGGDTRFIPAVERVTLR
jgi:hypothetical protein